MVVVVFVYVERESLLNYFLSFFVICSYVVVVVVLVLFVWIIVLEYRIFVLYFVIVVV